MASGRNGVVLGALEVLWQGRHRSNFLPYIGEPNVDKLWGFVLGLEAAALRGGTPDLEYVKFRDWLRDVRGEFPPEGWHRKFLIEAGGDHREASLRFLARVAEFLGCET